MSGDRSEKELQIVLDAARERVRRLESELAGRGVETGNDTEDRYRSLFENSADAILILDGDTFIDCNQATVEMLRYQDKQQLLETHPSELSPPLQPDGQSSYDKANEMIRIAVEQGSHRFEWDHKRADGEVFPVEVLLTPLATGGGTKLHVVWRDITQRKRLEEQLLQSQKMEAMGRLAGGIAHDFNNLLMVINGNTEKLLEVLGGDDWAAGVVRQIGWAGQRAAELTGQLLASSRKQVLQPKILDLNHVTEGAGEFLARLIGEDIELATVLSDDRVNFKADPSLIDQVIINLATNARDAMSDGGTLTLEVTRREIDDRTPVNGLQLPPGAYARLRVIDTGTGMDVDVLERAFEPFFTTKPIGEGSGLGLSMVYGIVRQSGGHLEIQSDTDNGTTVEIWFPAVDDDATEDPVETGPPLGGDETVLVVEDDSTVAIIVAEMLEAAGYRVLSASNGTEALEIWRQHDNEIDLVLTDVVMPHMGGPELVRRLQAEGNAPPTIFASGYTDNLLASYDELDSEAGFLQKPFNRPTLLRLVRKVLDREAS
jgi:PAS domain S-box-containing protein